MPALPVEIVLGIYLGILTGIIPAVVAWALGFLFKYFTGVSIPAFAVIVLALALAGANGGLLALTDPTVTDAPNQVTLTVAILVVLMISIYAHARGDAMGGSFPRHLSIRALGQRTLSTDVVELVGGRGQVRVSTVGDIADIEGYTPLTEQLRSEIREATWTFPADLPIVELESRLADTLRTDHDLADVNVTIDERGRVSIAAAPPVGGVSKRVPAGKRAVSVDTLVPTGLARGDEVEVRLDDGSVRGTVVSAKSTPPTPADGPSRTPTADSDDGSDDTPQTSEPPRAATPTADGGDGRVTLAVDRGDAQRVLGSDRVDIVVEARGTRREFELLSVLRRAGKRIRRVTVDDESDLAGGTIGDASIRDAYDVVVLGIKRPGGWSIAPRGSTPIAAGDDLFVVGTRSALDTFQGAAS